MPTDGLEALRERVRELVEANLYEDQLNPGLRIYPRGLNAIMEAIAEYQKPITEAERQETVTKVKEHSLWRNLNFVERLELEQMIRGLR